MTAARHGLPAGVRDRRVARGRSLTAFAAGLASLVMLACTRGDQSSRPSAEQTATAAANPLLRGPAAVSPKSPDVYRVVIATSRGPVTIEVQRALAPIGADRFYEMVSSGYFTDVRFFRVVPGFVAQFGMHGDPAVNAVWQDKHLTDEPVRTSNTRGTIVFATTPEPNSRANQFFINLVDNTSKLDALHFAPFGTVVEGMEVVDQLNSEYSETVNQGRLASKGNAYLRAWFPALDSITSAKVVTP